MESALTKSCPFPAQSFQQFALSKSQGPYNDLKNHLNLFYFNSYSPLSHSIPSSYADIMLLL